MTPNAEPVVRAALTGDELRTLAGAVTEIAGWPAGSHRFGHYAEMTPTGPAICRTENVSVCRPDVAALVADPLAELAAERFGAPVRAFKDKVNYKQPGGAGFRPHQDQTAYPDAPAVVSLLVAVDECHEESGCLWIAKGVDRALPTDDRGVVREDVAATLEWSMAELAPGDALVIDGLAPHWSGPNNGSTPRRVLVASYASVDSGYTRDQYYAARAERMRVATAADGRFRISTHADFAGVEVAPERLATTACTHG